MFNNILDNMPIEEPDLRYCSAANSQHEEFAVPGSDGSLRRHQESAIAPRPDNASSNNNNKNKNNKLIRGTGGVDFVRQTCKARGIETTADQNPHIARFAYIDIPVGTPCGTVLSCSHPVCAASGRRFRYCSHCKIAVAKRNFNVRHAHTELSNFAIESTTTTAGVAPNHPLLRPQPQHQKLPNKHYYNLASDFTEAANAHFEVTDVPSSTAGERNNSAPSRTTVSPPSRNKVPLNAQEIDFVHLLRTRPSDDYPAELEEWKVTLLSLTEKKQGTAQYAAVNNAQVHHKKTDSFIPYDAFGSLSSFNVEDFENFEFPVDFLEG